MPYQLLKIEKETTVIETRPVDIYVALVKKEGEEQPFRVVLENFETKDEALAQIHAWIAERTREDESAVVEAEKDRQTAVQDSIMNEINGQ